MMFNNQNNNNNPFETGNKRKSTSRQHSEKQVNQSNNNLKKSKSTLPVVFSIIGIILIGFFINPAYNDFALMREHERELESQEAYIVESYVYDPIILDDSFEQNPFTIDIPKGSELIVTKEHGRFIEGVDNTKLTLIVGEDLVPGVYTISTTENFHIQIDLLFDMLLPFKAGEYYNIPLMEGAKIDLTYNDDSEDFTTKFIPQTEYIEFKPGQNGIYVYGLSNFDSQIELNKHEYGQVDYTYYNPEYDSLKTNFYYEEDTKLNGIPGSYFIIEYDN